MRQQLEVISHMQQANEQHITMLTSTVATHEHEWECFRRAMRAAFEGYVNDEANHAHPLYQPDSPH